LGASSCAECTRALARRIGGGAVAAQTGCAAGRDRSRRGAARRSLSGRLSRIARDPRDRDSYDPDDRERYEWLDQGGCVRQVHFHPQQIPIAGSTFWDFRELLERTARGLEDGTIVGKPESSGELQLEYLSPRAKKPVSPFKYFA
jgi:hypothetical protein